MHRLLPLLCCIILTVHCCVALLCNSWIFPPSPGHFNTAVIQKKTSRDHGPLHTPLSRTPLASPSRLTPSFLHLCQHAGTDSRDAPPPLRTRSKAHTQRPAAQAPHRDAQKRRHTHIRMQRAQLAGSNSPITQLLFLTFINPLTYHLYYCYSFSHHMPGYRLFFG